jgi:hypothetical protein
MSRQSRLESMVKEFIQVDMGEVIDFISDEFEPIEVFSYDELERWALDNGFKKEED